MNIPDPSALAAATTIAELLTDPHTTPPATPEAGDGRGRPQSLAGGAAGIALLHIERARSGHGPWNVAHAWLADAARDDLSAGANANLYFGAPTLAFVTLAAADRPQKYAHALSQLDVSTDALTRRRLDAAHARIDRGDRPAQAEFDLIRGLAGLGAYHLRRHPHDDITRAVLDYLVRLTEPLPGHHDRLPGWWTHLAPNGTPSPDYAGGHGNIGMSHGIAGPLTVLALARRRGVTVDGHTDAITRIHTWLDQWRQRDCHGPWWPGIITQEHVHTGHVPPSNRQRPSWCYGTPGVARALQLAAIATGDTTRQQAAESAMLASLRDPEQLARITDTGLCHGIAGVYQSAWRIASDARTPDIAAELPRLAARLVADLRSAPDNAELLDGTAGAALALHTAGTGAAPHTDWDAFLLLS